MQTDDLITPHRQADPPEGANDLAVLSSSLPPGSLLGHDAYLGVSFSKNRYFSKERIRAYALWCEAYAGRLVIIVADHLEAYNTQVFQGISFEKALAKAVEKGLQLQKAYRRAIPASMATRVRVELASDILTEPACRRLVARVKEAAQLEPAFSADVQSAVFNHLVRRPPPPGASDEVALHRHAQVIGHLSKLENYVLEEIAIILYLTHVLSPPYPMAIFPYPPFAAVINIFHGPYKSRFEEITHSEPFEFIQLA